MHWEFLWALIFFSTAFWIFNKWSFFKNSGVSVYMLNGLLIFKIISAIFISYYFIKSQTLDYLGFNAEEIGRAHV